MDFIVGNGYKQGNNEFESQFQYGDNLPPYYIAQLSLMKILSQHRRINAGLFDRILQWACWFSDKYPDIWSTRSNHKCHTRNSTLLLLLDFFQLQHIRPSPVKVTMSDGAKVESIPSLSFRGVLKGLMLDPNILCDDNLIINNFCKDTW